MRTGRHKEATIEQKVIEMGRIEHYIGFVLFVGSLAVIVVASALPFMQSVNGQVEFTLWQRRQIYQGVTSDTWLRDVTHCQPTTEHIQIACAFAMICIALHLFLSVSVILDCIDRPMHRWSSELFALGAAAASTVCWALLVETYTRPICGSGFTPSGGHFVLTAGFWLHIATTAALLVLALMLFVFRMVVRPYYYPYDVAQKESTALQRRRSTRTFEPNIRQPAPQRSLE